MKVVWLVLLLLIPWSQAAPLRLTLQQQNDGLQFDYRFLIDGIPQQLSFTLADSALNNTLRQFKPFKPALFRQYLWRDIQRHVAQYPGASVQRLPRKDSLEYRLKTSDPALLQQLQTELANLQQEKTAEFLQREFYRYHRLPDGRQVIIPDHARLMQESLPMLLPVANALHNNVVQLTSRQAVNYISQWIQQIPYQDLSDRLQSSGASYSTPLRVLRENRADCDSKAVLLAALIRMLLPDMRLAIVYLPDHAVLALRLTPQADDSKVSIAGVDYILVDATGPALLPVGRLSDRYKIYTQSGGFSYQLL